MYMSMIECVYLCICAYDACFMFVFKFVFCLCVCEHIYVMFVFCERVGMNECE